MKYQISKIKYQNDNAKFKIFKTFWTLICNFNFCILIFAFYLIFGLWICYAQEAPTQPKAEAPATEQEEVIPGNITCDFKDADIKNVLKIIAYKSRINIVATPEVVGTVTIKLENVPWEKALDTIVRTYGFGYEWLNDKVIMVSTLEKLAEQRKIQAEAAEREPLDTQAFVLNFSKADDIKTAVEKLVSPRGKITLETRTNTLIITDTKSNLMKIGEVVKGLDKITPQVLIEAKIIETTLGSSEKLGIDWTVKVTARGAKRPTTLPFEPKGEEKWMKNVFPPGTGSSDFPAEYSFPYTKAAYEKGVLVGDFTFGALDFSQFQAVLEILESRSDTKIISNPRITTLNNQEAKMMVGKIVPIPIYEFSKETGTRIISGYEDLEIGIKLLVTPSINEQNYITLNIKPSVEEIESWALPSGAIGERPIISSRSAEAKVMIKDGHTLVMGGLISEKKIKSRKKLPILGDIPILGFFFSKKEDTLDKTDLLIFITPRIVKEEK